ncbi:MAG: hypothetical protein WDZ58_04070, partial [Gemmatimonadaceae bacterium]
MAENEELGAEVARSDNTTPDATAPSPEPTDSGAEAVVERPVRGGSARGGGGGAGRGRGGQGGGGRRGL